MKGFTLIEILLAASLTALIAVGALFYLEGARNLGARIEYKADLFQTGRAVLQQMERDIQSAYASGQGLDLGLKGTDSTLSDPPTDSLELVSANNFPKDEEKKECDLTRTIYRIDADRGLVRERIKELTKTGIVVLNNSGDTITKKITGLDIRYHDGTTWTSSWDSAAMGAMPKAIEVTLTVVGRYKGGEETEKFTSAFWLPVGQTYEAPK
jgi:prepilin-type N-terminal cleavage/methylation domain-containing protein